MAALHEDMSEEEIRELESHIPEMAVKATRLAYEHAKRSSMTVVVAKAGFIVAEHHDGSESVLCPAMPRRKVRAGVPILLGMKPG